MIFKKFRDNQVAKQGSKRSRNTRPEFKELLMGVLQHNNKYSMHLRLSFWINRIVKLIFKSKQKTVKH